MYESDTENGLDMEVACHVTDSVPETERIKVRELEPVKEMACVIHKGEPEKLADAYAAIQQWMEAVAYKVAGPIREVHWVGYWSNPNPAEHVTEIQIPVKKEPKE